MNHFYLPVSLGTIEVRWNSVGLLSQLHWSQNQITVTKRAVVPAGISDLIDWICKFFDDGRPLGKIPWEQLDQSSWSDFQRRVYHQIMEIPHGETRTYGWVARKLGNCSASRAVGQALKNNPIPIVIPCHRVVSTTSIGGFMGTQNVSEPQLQLKQKLISLEEQYCNPSFAFFQSAYCWGSFNQIGIR